LSPLAEAFAAQKTFSCSLSPPTSPSRCSDDVPRGIVDDERGILTAIAAQDMTQKVQVIACPENSRACPFLKSPTVTISGHVLPRQLAGHKSTEECRPPPRCVFPYRGVYGGILGMTRGSRSEPSAVFNAQRRLPIKPSGAGGDASLTLVSRERYCGNWRHLRLRDTPSLAFGIQRRRIDARAQVL